MPLSSRRQLLDIVRSFDRALAREKEARLDAEREDWVRHAQVHVSTALQGDLTVSTVAERALDALASYVGADVGAFYAVESGELRQQAGFGLDDRVASGGPTSFAMRQGMVGQAAAGRKLRRVRDVPAEHFRLRSGTGESSPAELTFLVAAADGTVEAVVELGFFRPMEERAVRVFERIEENIAIAVRSARYRTQLKTLLEQSQRQAEELQTQQEELRVANEELQSQSDALRSAHAELEERKAELEASNASLEEQRDELARAQRALEEKAAEIARASRYKSEFLANMSHELRTPLNSLLILSKMLAENRTGNLTGEQVKFAQTVYTSGNELLTLINEILDLSKVEAGKMPIDPRTFRINEVRDYLDQTFRHVADQKSLFFEINTDDRLPETIFSDVNRLQQILKNLLSNAFKFTAKGGVTMSIAPAAKEKGDHLIAFIVKDTGIGIPQDKQRLIFDAFQQADGTTSRKYGGTGLGLTISREIARLLGGSIEVVSAPDQGSTFTLYLPRTYTAADILTAREELIAARAEAAEDPVQLPTDATFHGRTVLLVDDDMRNVFAIRSVLEERDMKVLHAENGRIAIELLQTHPHVDLVLMDTMMPEMDGVSATRAIRDIIQFQTLPIVSLTAKAMKGDREKALEAGATDYVTKPVDPERLLAVIHRWMSARRNDAVSRLS